MTVRRSAGITTVCATALMLLLGGLGAPPAAAQSDTIRPAYSGGKVGLKNFTVKYAGSKVTLTARFTKFTKSKWKNAVLFLSTSDKRRPTLNSKQFTITVKRSSKTVKVVDAYASKRMCKGGKAKISVKYGDNGRIRVTVPRRCLGKPKYVAAHLYRVNGSGQSVGTFYTAWVKRN